MKRTLKYFFFALLIGLSIDSKAQTPFQTGIRTPVPDPKKVDIEAINGKSKNNPIPGADQTDKYLPYLKGKRIGMVVNQTSTIRGLSSVDYLYNNKVTIAKIFGPEHGFRGNASAGAKINDAVDQKTGIPVISLYGTHYKPTKEDLSGIDLMIFDIQDVGARFYTYTSTLHYVMEACAENNVELMILDRPNPNGSYVDGPVMEDKFKSFIGMHPVPITHGMTVLLYPSLCLFEGTIISLGRGTYFPFQVLGSPDLAGKYKFSFKPVSIAGMSESPLHKDKVSYGLDLRKYNTKRFVTTGQLNLKWLMELYKAYPDKSKFFDQKQSNQIGNFDRLAGTAALKQQIIDGKTEEEIRMSWEPNLSRYKIMRKKYLLYQ
jgi:uncharacterized protein YbbC (DUF1343 family)